MPESQTGERPAILNLNAYSPSEIQQAIETAGVAKADMRFLPCFMLAVVAGGSIGFGAMSYTIVMSDAQLSFAVARVLGGFVFSLGLVLVLVCRAELFTGNNLIVMACASRRVSLARMLRNWVIVFTGNVVGALGLVSLVILSRQPEMNSGLIAQTVIKTAAAKIEPDFTALFFRGVLCNVLVCMAVWIAYGGRSVTDKIVGLILPISAFVAAGFEHCIANLYFLPLAWLLVHAGLPLPQMDVSPITAAGVVHNLIPVTLGNVAGGAGLVGFVYWAIYRKGLAARLE